MSELYKLPNGWEWKKLSSICRFINGKAYKKVELLNRGKYPVLRVGNFFTNNNWYYSDLELPDDKYCDYGDLLYAWSASFGPKIWTGKKSIYHYHIWKLIPNYELVDKSFLYQILDWDVEQIKLDQGTGTTMIHITKGSIEARMVPIPPLKEQKRIVSKLDTLFEKIDKAIELHEKNIKEVDAFMGSVLNEVFEELEVKYEVKNIGSMLDLLTDYHSNGAYKTLKANVELLDNENYALMIRATDLENKDYKKNVKFITEEAYHFMSKSKVYGGEIILPKIGSIGSVYFMPSLNRPVSLAMNIFMLRCSSHVDNKYLFLYLKSPIGNQNILKRANGAVTKTITKDAVKSITLSLPPLNIQQKVVKYLDEVSLKIEKTKAIQKEKLQNLKDLKASILDQAFKGQL